MILLWLQTLAQTETVLNYFQLLFLRSYSLLVNDILLENHRITTICPRATVFSYLLFAIWLRKNNLRDAQDFCSANILLLLGLVSASRTVT
jgi:hypothetical protein